MRFRRTVLAACAGLALAGCAGPGSATSPPASPSPGGAVSTRPSGGPAPATGGTAASPLHWVGGSTGDAVKDAVQLAVQRYWSMFTRLAERPDPDDPAIAMLSADPQASRLVRIFRQEAQQHRSQVGPADGSVSAIAILRAPSGTEARADTCLDLRRVQVYEANGSPVPGGHGGLDIYILSLRLVGTAWRVTDTQSPTGTCVVGG
jgi:hypothetical protein